MNTVRIVCCLALGLVGCYPAKDCTTACDHMLACQGVYDDSDLASLTRERCLEACAVDDTVHFCFDDCDPSEIHVRWRCATGTTDCSSLDHTCDVY